MKPSDVKDIIPQFSIWADYGIEKVAMWTARALAETGDTWRVITWEEIEALIDKNEPGFSPTHFLMHRKYLPTVSTALSSEWTARRVSRLWWEIEADSEMVKVFSEYINQIPSNHPTD